MANMRRLEYMDVGLNKFSGQIPQWFGAFPRLEYLIARNNSFSGSIPQGFGNLQSLKFLRLQFNQLIGSIPSTIFNMSSLEVLDFSGNSLSGNLPVDMCNYLPKLEVLNLKYNELEGQIPPGLQECSKLLELVLSYNRFTGRIPSEIGNLTMLEGLHLGFNSLEGEIPGEFANLVNLEQLAVDNAGLEGNIPSFLFNMSLDIYLSQNNFSGSLPRNICPGPFLRALAIGANKLTGSIPSEIGNCTALGLIDLGNNNFTGTIPKEFWEVDNFLQTNTLATIGYIAPEYGQEGLVSTNCDVYSFGILMMEVFTGKKPTDEMFTSDLSLSCWVSEALVNGVTQAIDSRLIRKEEEHFFAEVSCVSSIFELALNCTAESLENRINIKDALALLQKIRLEFLAKSSGN
ncbi:hypothetical protein Vadar_011669 [Vaccinium darrowii]|uniref:Uncharacterized protein n=1 Tax=Vaccinium darrowii TaxID=229202 RepID=A0ACB7XI37_9ERIC|nr:hypothetical protein Vadar_011669 [Vaccinium darrowii]